MDAAVQAPIPVLVIALAAATLLFGVFFNRAVKAKIRSWWRGLDLHPFGDDSVPHAEIRREPRPAPKHARNPRASPPHAEKKEAPTHRSG